MTTDPIQESASTIVTTTCTFKSAIRLNLLNNEDVVACEQKSTVLCEKKRYRNCRVAHR